MMLSLGEMVVLAGAAIFFLGRKEGLKMLQTSSKTVSKFWKQASRTEGAAASKTPAAAAKEAAKEAARKQKD